MDQLRTNVYDHTTRRWYGPAYPENGAPPAGTFPDDLFEGAERPRIGVEHAEGSTPPATPTLTPGGGEHSTQAGPTDEPPPKHGQGSGEDAWRAYAAARGIDVTGLDKRADIITACEAAGVPTEPAP